MPPPRGLVQQLDHYLHKARLLEPRQRLLVACSGGADSVALVRLLHAVNGSDHWGWRLVVGHVNHQLRGPESDADALLVRGLARELGLGFVSKRVVIRRTGSGVASEEAARQARYAALGGMMRARQCAAVIVAHHAEDQAETILLRMLRGCGIRGLGGMAARTRIDGCVVVRPLLEFGRQQLRGYLREIGQTWREDASNASGAFLRNRLRHEVLPVLLALQPGLVRSLARLGTNARLASGTLERLAQRVLTRATLASTASALKLDRAVLRRTPLELRRGALRAGLLQRGGQADQLDFQRLLEAVREIQRPPAGPRRFEFAGGLWVTINREHVTLRRAKRGVR